MFFSPLIFSFKVQASWLFYHFITLLQFKLRLFVLRRLTHESEVSLLPASTVDMLTDQVNWEYFTSNIFITLFNLCYLWILKIFPDSSFFCWQRNCIYCLFTLSMLFTDVVYPLLWVGSTEPGQYTTATAGTLEQQQK